jgi:hypothetical protein
MNRYLPIVCSVMFVGMVALPRWAWAASITETTATIGYECQASGDKSTAMGHRTKAIAGASTAMGYNTLASGFASTAMGIGTLASSDSSTAMGYNTTASGFVSTAMGIGTLALGIYSTAMGYYTTASGGYSTVVGKGYGPEGQLINNIAYSFMVGYMADASDTTPEFFVKDGGVGINTTNPGNSLHVEREISGSPVLANHVAAVVNTSSNTNPNVLLLKVNIANPTTASNFITFRDSANPIGAIEGNGSGGIRLSTSGGDFAEYLTKADPNETLTPGEIVGLFPEGLSKKTDNAERIMVVTTAPAVLGNQPKETDESRYAPVAFLGQAPVRVEGEVRSGDYIVPSGRGDGIGRAVPPAELTPVQYGAVIGRALQTRSEKGVKTVTTLVGLPQNGLWNTAMEAKDARIAQLEGRLAALEARSDTTTGMGLLPGAGIIMGSLGFFWVDRRRRRS